MYRTRGRWGLLDPPHAPGVIRLGGEWLPYFQPLILLSGVVSAVRAELLLVALLLLSDAVGSSSGRRWMCKRPGTEALGPQAARVVHAGAAQETVRAARE